MENKEQKFYEDLRLSEKLKYRREFNGFSGNIVWFIVYFLACGIAVTGMTLWMIFFLSTNRQYWHMSGITISHIGMFVLFSMMLMMNSKQKNLLKALGSKKQIILFFVSISISIIGNIFVIAYIFSENHEAWLYWVSTMISTLGAMVFLIPHIMSPKKDRAAAKKESENFFIWLENEKNIIRKVSERQN